MQAKNKLGIGAVLSIFGGIGIGLAPTLGISVLGRPWSFLAGFFVGVVGGIGVALAIAGMVELRNSQ